MQPRLTSVFVPERHGVFNVPSSELSTKSIQVTVIFLLITIKKVGPGSSVGIATDYGLDGPGIESR